MDVDTSIPQATGPSSETTAPRAPSSHKEIVRLSNVNRKQNKVSLSMVSLSYTQSRTRRRHGDVRRLALARHCHPLRATTPLTWTLFVSVGEVTSIDTAIASGAFMERLGWVPPAGDRPAEYDYAQQGPSALGKS